MTLLQVTHAIEKDIAAGIVPCDVRDFAELHDYLDANEYIADAFDAGVDAANALIDEIDAWLAS